MLRTRMNPLALLLTQHEPLRASRQEGRFKRAVMNAKATAGSLSCECNPEAATVPPV
jgi:hypothetical protein